MIKTLRTYGLGLLAMSTLACNQNIANRKIHNPTQKSGTSLCTQLCTMIGTVGLLMNGTQGYVINQPTCNLQCKNILNCQQLNDNSLISDIYHRDNKTQEVTHKSHLIITKENNKVRLNETLNHYQYQLPYCLNSLTSTTNGKSLIQGGIMIDPKTFKKGCKLGFSLTNLTNGNKIWETLTNSKIDCMEEISIYLQDKPNTAVVLDTNLNDLGTLNLKTGSYLSNKKVRKKSRKQKRFKAPKIIVLGGISLTVLLVADQIWRCCRRQLIQALQRIEEARPIPVQQVQNKLEV